MLRTRARRHRAALEAEPDQGSGRARDADQAIALAEHLQDQGDMLGAIEVLSRAARTTGDGRIMRRLVRFRFRAFKSLEHRTGTGARPVPADPFPTTTDRPPEVALHELHPDLVRGAIVHHGCLLVRNALAPERVEKAAAGLDRSLEALATVQEGGKDRWYDPLDPPGRNLERIRSWVQVHGGLWIGDSPPMLFEVLDAYESSGVLRAVADYLGERPALSLEKSTLRRMPKLDEPSTWHQDGAFMGNGARTLNVWVALSDCGTGTTAPGLDIIPRRFEEIFATGAPIAGSDLREGEDAVAHAIAPELTDQLTEVTPACRPTFSAGDALLFDEMMPHRTANGPEYPDVRKAIETWFFAPSTFPGGYVPLVC